MELTRHDKANVVSRLLNKLIQNCDDKPREVLSFADYGKAAYAKVWVNPTEDRIQLMWTIGREDKDHALNYQLSDSDTRRKISKHYAEAVKAIRDLPYP